jgi:hypothetical protein
MLFFGEISRCLINIDLQILRQTMIELFFRQESKERISAALRKAWESRIVSIKSRQKVLQIWSNSIAEAAKEGDHSQDKLDWDSYDRIKLEMISMFVWNKERERIIRKLKKTVVETVAKKLQAERKKIRARGTKKLEPEKLLPQNSYSQPTRMVVSARPKLKERLTKVMDIAYS